MFHYEKIERGLADVSIDLKKLYKTEKQIENFKKRFTQFINKNEYNSRVFYTNDICSLEKENNIIKYKTESIIPTNQNDKLKLLIILGNPASHSVDTGIFFAYKDNKNKTERNFWKVLRELKIIDLKIPEGYELNNEKSVRQRKEDLYNLNYNSPFRISLDVFFTIPNGTNQGVDNTSNMGVYQLFQKKAFHKIAKHEKDRLKLIIQEHNAILVFQKDTYKELRSSDSPVYDWKTVLKEGIIGKTYDKELYYCPPTRTITRKNPKKILRKFRKKMLRHNS